MEAQKKIYVELDNVTKAELAYLAQECPGALDAKERLTLLSQRYRVTIGPLSPNEYEKLQDLLRLRFGILVGK